MSGSQMPSELFRALDAAQNDPIEKVLAALPILPPVIRYYDEFDDCVRSIPDPEGSDSFEYMYDGSRGVFDFARFGRAYGLLLKHVFAFVLGEDLSMSTVLHAVGGGLHISRDDMASVLSATPTGILRLWKILRSRDMPTTAYSCVKTVLRMLCRHRLNGWSESYLEFLSALPWPAGDAYAGVRSGDAFLSVDEEASIVRYLDGIADQVATESGRAAGALPPALDEAGMLLCAYIGGLLPPVRYIGERKGVLTVLLAPDVVRNWEADRLEQYRDDINDICQCLEDPWTRRSIAPMIRIIRSSTHHAQTSPSISKISTCCGVSA
ncbi:hypothetical protein AB4Y32_22850 [Paraburkholderia phymatum]|uniref:Uncharacterized protein n=1 Tax=Paraburkholderia phymatum TaxID=148447 RepID=A0ACC6U4K2_9BURK